MRPEDWLRLLPPETVFVGVTAAAIHGLGVARDYVEIAVPPGRGTRSRRGLMVRHLVLAPGDVVKGRHLHFTSLHRTLRDMCRLEPAVEALVAIDSAVHLRRTTKAALRAYVACVAGLPGTKRLRRLVELAEPAESPMETRLRWLLINARLPTPQVQPNLHNADGDFVGRADLYYPQARLVIEFDGGNHRDRLISDNRRQNLLTNAGFRVLRFTAADLQHHPDVVISNVRSQVFRKPP